MKHLLFLLPLSSLLAVFTPNTTPTPPTYPRDPLDLSSGALTNPAVTDATAEASHWLNLLDQGQYGATWLDASPLMKDIVTENEWIGAMDEVRAPFGNALSRKISHNQSLSQLPHGTKGNFMLVEYNTQFSGNYSGKERLVLMTNPLGQWRVVSYDVKSMNR